MASEMKIIPRKDGSGDESRPSAGGRTTERLGSHAARAERETDVSPPGRSPSRTLTGVSRRGGVTAVIGARTTRRIASGPLPESRFGKTVVSVRRPGGGISSATRVVGVSRVSGRTIVRPREEPPPNRRLQLLAAYAAVYVVLAAGYLWVGFDEPRRLTTAEFMDMAFPKYGGSDIAGLMQASRAAMRGSRPPAEVRLAFPLSFRNRNGDPVAIESGERLTLREAAEFGAALREDLSRDEKARIFGGPILLRNETFLTRLDWPYWLNLYNLAGFFLLCGLFLWRPVVDALGDRAKKTAASLDAAYDAQDRADELRDRARRMREDFEAQKTALLSSVAASSGEEAAAAESAAKKQAELVIGHLQAAVGMEARSMQLRIRSETAEEACRLARGIIEKRISPGTHDDEVEACIASLKTMKWQRPGEIHGA